MDILLQPTLAGAALAALSVAGGAPIFSDGLRTLRLRRQLQALKEHALEQDPSGFVHTKGRVVLDSPLFSPLSGRPCAGFRLEVVGGVPRREIVIQERRPFRITAGDTSARVMAATGRWILSETGRREIAPGDSLSENLAALLARSPEAQLLKGRRTPILLIEHALFAGDETHVVGHIRRARAYELTPEMELMRTGTDDAIPVMAGRTARAIDLVADGEEPEVQAAPSRPRGAGPFGIERRRPGRPFPGEVDLWMDAGGLLDFMLISDAPPSADTLSVSRWRTLGLLLGPALSLTGLLYLAHVADRLHSQGRF